MIIRNKSNKPIGIGGENLVVLLPDEEKFVSDKQADTNGVKTLTRLGLIECRAEVKQPVADEKPVVPAPAEEPAAEEKKPAAKKSKAKAE